MGGRAFETITVGVGALVCAVMHATMGWVPILDSFNLAIHEAGHPLTGLLFPSLAVYGGTLFQLGLPCAALLGFRREGNPTGMAVCGVWLGENLLGVARYMADARAQVLPLAGGGEHDWADILGRFGILQWDTTCAALVRVCAVAVMVAAVALLSGSSKT